MEAVSTSSLKMGYYLGLWWLNLDFKLDSEGADRRQTNLE